MHRLSRAPFLAPQILGATTRLSTARIARCAPSAVVLQRLNHAARPPRAAQTRQRQNLAQQTMTESLTQQFRQACETRNVHQIIDLYPSLLDASLLGSYDTRRITQALHVRMRITGTGSKPLDLFPFVQQVAADIRRGALPPHPYAFVHLFGIYKDCKRFDQGYELWTWLVEQDERYVSQAAYGAAIELMAYGGMLKLPHLEALYVDGLKRFPGTFAEYHLSPDAIVPDRTQPTVISGIPTILLQGILTARILARDWKMAYLALDTALRLYPTQTPPRYFELFMTERPLSEAYTAFLLACRAGVCLRPTHFTVLLTKMRAAMKASPSMPDRMMLVRAIVNALYAYLQAGARLESIHVGAFIRAFEQLLPEKVAGQDYEGVAADLRNIIAVAAHKIMSDLIQAGLSPQIHPFEALISLSGKFRVPGLLTTILQDIKTAGIDLGPIGIRSAMTSAGLVGNKDLVEQLWERIAANAEAEKAQIPFEDWITLTKACRRTKNITYFQTQLLKLSHAITSDIEQQLIQQIGLREVESSDLESFQYMIPGDLESQIEKLRTQIESIEAVLMSAQPLEMSKSPFYMHLDPEAPPLGPISQLRSIYDGMTTDPHQPPPAPLLEGSAVSPAQSSTGILLGDLRFQNWVTVLEMMEEAEAYESDYQFALDVAMKTGKPLEKAQEVLRLQKEKRRPCHSTQELRLKILALRAASPVDVSVYRKIGSEVSSEKFKPMVYHAGDDKWRRRRISKHPTSKQPNYVHKERSMQLDQFEGTRKLTYYVGLQSHHGAPWKPLRKILDKKDLVPDTATEQSTSHVSSTTNTSVPNEPSSEIPHV